MSLTRAEWSTLNFLDMQIGSADRDVQHLERVVAGAQAQIEAGSATSAELSYTRRRLTIGTNDLDRRRAELDDWRRVRGEVDALFAMRDDLDE